MKNVPMKYRSEESVKHALKIDSFRNLSKDKVMQFVSMIPYVDKDVAIAIINQFPVYADFGKVAIEYFSQLTNNLLEKNNEIQLASIKGFQTTLEALSKMLEKDNITEDERKYIIERMISLSYEIKEADLNNKKFLEKVGNKILLGVIGVTAILGAAIGVCSNLGGDSSLPEIDDDNDNEDQEDDC